MPATANSVATPGRSSTRPGDFVTDSLLVAMAAIWAINYTVAKYGTRTVPPLAYNAVRIVMATIVLLVIGQLRSSERPSRGDIVALLVIGVLGNGLYQFCFIEGLAR